ncbi:MAG: HAMP domain-containing protein [Nitrospirae bacterium]|nr:HAMP domain-containing protein [Nitrospirota bacterium]
MGDVLRRYYRTLAAKLIIAVGLLMLVGSFVFWYAILYKQEKDLQSIAVRYSDSFIKFVKERTYSGMLTAQRPLIQQTLEDISIAESIEGVSIFNHEGATFFSSKKEDIGKLVNKETITCKGCHLEIEKPVRLMPYPQKWTIYKNDKGFRTLKVVEPIYNEPSCYTAKCHFHAPEQKILGFIEANLSLALIDKAEFRQGIALTGYVLIFFLAISASLGIVLYKIVSKPVSQLVSGMEKVAKGDFEHSVDIKTGDEIGALADAFTLMAKDIKAAKEQQEQWTHKLEAEVAKKAEEIQKTHAGMLQTEKLASLGRMAAGVAHEINNPLTGIVTFAHLMLRRVPPDSEDAEDLKVIIEQAERCAKIIRGLLTFARATPSEKAEVVINDILSRTIYMVKNQEKFHNIKFNINIDDSPRFIAVGDLSQYQQIFLNMLINAADAMNERGVVTIATRKIIINDKPFVEIEFTDTGCGIPEEDMDKLFEPFFTTKPVGKGTGLGLSVSHGIVKHYGGEVLVKSAVGKGTSFFIRLPLVESVL